MDLGKFTAFMTEGLPDATVRVARNGEDFEMRVREVPDLVGLMRKSTRLGLREVTVSVDEDPVPPGVILTFVDAVDAEFTDDTLRLSNREYQVMEMLARGVSKHQIATDLAISVKTFDTHRGHLLKKLGLASNADLVRYAIKHGIVGA